MVSALTLVIAAAGIYAQSTPPAVQKQVGVSPGLYELAASASTGRVYVAATGTTNGATPGIHVIDGKTLERVSTIDTSSAPAFGVGLNDRTQMLYTSNTRAGNVSAIDLKAGKIVATIQDPALPKAHTFRVLVDEESNTVYVSIAMSPGRIWVIDGKTNTIASTIEAGERTTGLTLNRAAGRLYAASMNTNDIAVVDLKTKTVVGRLPSGGERPTQLAFDDKTGRLFVTNQGTGTLGIVDTKSGTLLHSVKTGAGALGVGFNPKNGYAYVANRQAGTVTVVNPTTGAVVTDLKAGTLPNTVAIQAQTGAVYVTNKARPAGRGRGAAEATPPPPPDEAGDTLTMIH